MQPSGSRPNAGADTSARGSEPDARHDSDADTHEFVLGLLACDQSSRLESIRPTIRIMQQSDSSSNACPNCDHARGHGRKCGRCGYRFDVSDVDASQPAGLSAEPPSARWRDGRSASYAGKVALVAVGIVIGAVAATPSEDKVALATASANKIEKRADRRMDTARDRADELVSEAESEAADIAEQSVAERQAEAAKIAALRKTTAALTKRRSALSRAARSLTSQVNSQRSELRSVKSQLSDARSSLESATPSSGSGSGCHPSYSGACLSQGAGDYDCAGGSGDGPNYTGTVSVVGYDEFDLDRDGDGVACDS